jgi:hypothetical protein
VCSSACASDARKRNWFTFAPGHADLEHRREGELGVCAATDHRNPVAVVFRNIDLVIPVLRLHGQASDDPRHQLLKDVHFHGFILQRPSLPTSTAIRIFHSCPYAESAATLSDHEGVSF